MNMRLIRVGILVVGGAALIAFGYAVGGVAAIAVGALTAVIRQRK